MAATLSESLIAANRSALSTEAPADRNGQLVLFVVFCSLLGGRFSLQRLDPGLPDVDLRWIALATSVVAFLGWVATAGVKATPHVRLRGLMVPFLAWCFWMALSALWVDRGARVLAGLLDFAFLASFVLLAVVVATRLSAEAVSAVWFWVFLAGIVYFVGAIAGSPDAQGRYSAFGGGPNVFVRVMVLAALAAVFLAARQRRVLFLLALPPLLLGAVLSGSRGGLLAGLLVFALGGLSVVRKLPRSAVMFGVVGLGATVAIAPRLLGPGLEAGLRERFVEQTVVQGYDSGRSSILDGAVQLFQSHPFVGAGLDGYYAELGRPLGYEYPHNFFVASAAEGGLVGLALLLGAIWHLVRAANYAKPMSTEGLFFLLGGGFILAASMFSGDYYDSRMAWFLLGLAAVEGLRPRNALGPDADLIVRNDDLNHSARRQASRPGGVS